MTKCSCVESRPNALFSGAADSVSMGNTVPVNHTQPGSTCTLKEPALFPSLRQMNAQRRGRRVPEIAPDGRFLVASVTIAGPWLLLSGFSSRRSNLAQDACCAQGHSPAPSKGHHFRRLPIGRGMPRQRLEGIGALSRKSKRTRRDSDTSAVSHVSSM
jgi:hypothetical protein